MRRRSFFTIGGGVFAAALAGVRFGFPTYRVRLYEVRDATRSFRLLGQWDVKAIEQAPDIWRETEATAAFAKAAKQPSGRHLWIEPDKGSGWCEGSTGEYPGEAAYRDGLITLDQLRPAHVWGQVPWGEVDWSGGPDGYCVEWQRIA